MRLFILLMLFFFIIDTQAQKKVISNCINLSKKGEYKEALKEFEKISNLNANVLYHKALCYYNIPELRYKSLPYFLKASTQTDEGAKEFNSNQEQAPVKVFFYLAKVYQQLDSISKAQFYYHKFLDTEWNVIDQYEAHDELLKCRFAVVQKERKSDFLVMPLNAANNEKNNYFQGFMSDNSIQTLDEKLITYALKDTSIINTTSSPTGKDLIYNITNRKGLYVLTSETKKTVEISVQGVTGMEDGFNADYHEATGFLSEDGKFFFLSTDKMNGAEGLDLFYFKKEADNKWSKGMNLGDNINTRTDESFPFYDSATGWLYFSSKGHENMGGYDIYYTYMEENGSWSKPVHLGAPINSPANDILFHNNSTSKKAFFSSDRGAKDYDVFLVDYEKPAIPDENTHIIEVHKEITVGYVTAEQAQNLDKVIVTDSTSQSGNKKVINEEDLDSYDKVDVIRSVEKEVEVFQTEEIEVEKEVEVGLVNIEDANKVDKIHGIKEVEKEVEVTEFVEIEIKKEVEKEVEVIQTVEVEKEVTVGMINASDADKVDKIESVKEIEIEKEVEVTEFIEVEKEVLVGFINIEDTSSVDRIYGIREINVGEINIEDTAKVDMIHAIKEVEVIVEKEVAVGFIPISDTAKVERIYGVIEHNIGEISINDTAKVDKINAFIEKEVPYYIGSANLEDLASLDEIKISLDTSLVIYKLFFKKNLFRESNQFRKQIDLAITDLLDSKVKNIIIESSISKIPNRKFDNPNKLALRNGEILKKKIEENFKKSDTSPKIRVIPLVQGPEYLKNLSKNEFDQYQYFKITAF